MSPEQCLADPNLDGKADVYALGIMLYEMLSDRLPFSAEHSFDYMVAHVRGTPRPLNEVAPQVPPEVVDLCHSMIAKDPAERPSMETVVVLLEQLRAVTAAIWAIPRLSGPHPQLGCELLATGETEFGSAMPPPARQSRESLAMGATVAGRSTPSARLSRDALLRTSQAGAGGPSSRSGRAAASHSLLAEPPPAPLPLPERAPTPAPLLPERAGASRGIALGGLAAVVLVGLVIAGGRLRALPVAAPPAAIPTAAVPSPAPRLVRWTVLSVPLGAEVVRGDGQLLGTTPLELERPPSTGETVLTLRYPGYKEKAMVLSHSTDVKTEVRLEALPTVAAPAAAAPEREAGSASAAAKRRKTRVRSGAAKAPGPDVELLLD